MAFKLGCWICRQFVRALERAAVALFLVSQRAPRLARCRRILIGTQDFGTTVSNSAIPLELVNSRRDACSGRARPRFPRTLSGLELGPLDQSSEEPVAQAAATPGCAVALLAWGYLARDGAGR